MIVKLKDIADATGFSVNTVSRALRNDPKISQATHDAIVETATRLGYIPNVIAGSMRSNRSRTIGVVSADSANPFFAEVIQGVEEMARKLKYSILLINTEERSVNEREAVKLLLGRQVDGLIIVPVYNDPENLAMYQSLEVPFIFVGRRVNGLEHHSILHGDKEGQALAVGHLLDRGHRRLLYIAGPKNISNTVDRLEGLRNAFAQRGLTMDDAYILPSSGHIEDGYAQVNHAINKGLTFSAVVCFNDLLAMGALKSLYENSLKVPSDVEVFGFDNLSLSQFMQPRLTTVDVPKNRLGKTAVEELVHHIENPELAFHTVDMTPRLVIRETTSEHHRD